MRPTYVGTFFVASLLAACSATTVGSADAPSTGSEDGPPQDEDTSAASKEDPPASTSTPTPAPTSPPATPAAQEPTTLPLPALGQLSVDEGGRKYTCINTTAELLDPSSSKPRFILWADCPGNQRLSFVVYPTNLPGTAPALQGLRFLDVASSQEWRSTDGALNVTALGKVGAVVEGNLEVTMSARLNQAAFELRGSFRATRTPDRYAP